MHSIGSPSSSEQPALDLRLAQCRLEVGHGLFDLLTGLVEAMGAEIVGGRPGPQRHGAHVRQPLLVDHRHAGQPAPCRWHSSTA